MENKDSLVSIVIPTYNVENYIEKSFALFWDKPMGISRSSLYLTVQQTAA